MSWILLSKGLCYNLQNDLIEEDMEVQWSEKFTVVCDVQRYCEQALMPQLFFPPSSCPCYLFLDPDGLISAMRAEGSGHLELMKGYSCRLQEPHGSDCLSALCSPVLLEVIH